MTELPTRMSERFTLAEVIGRGTCSTVFRARDELLDRDVAVKIFPVTDDPRVAREVPSSRRSTTRRSCPSTTSARSTAARSSSWRCSRAATSPTGWRPTAR